MSNVNVKMFLLKLKQQTSCNNKQQQQISTLHTLKSFTIHRAWTIIVVVVNFKWNVFLFVKIARNW